MPGWRERLDRYRNPRNPTQPPGDVPIANRQYWVDACEGVLRDLRVNDELKSFQRDLLARFGKVEGPLIWDGMQVGSYIASSEIGNFSGFSRPGLTVAYRWSFCQQYYEQVPTKWKTQRQKYTYEVQGNWSGNRSRHEGTREVQVPTAWQRVKSEECQEIIVEALYSPNPDSLGLRVRGTPPPNRGFLYPNDYRRGAGDYLAKERMPVGTDELKKRAAEGFKNQLLNIYSRWNSSHWLPMCIADHRRNGRQHSGSEHP